MLLPQQNIIQKQLKLKSFAMIYSVVVLIFMSIICSAFIMLLYYNKIYLDISIQREKLVGNAVSGINLFLCEPAIVGTNETKKVQLYDSEFDEIQLTKKKWGVFDLIISTASWRKHKYSKIALTGDVFTEEDKMALYLADRGKPLGICGETILKGTVSIPEAGIITTNIEGKNYIGAKTVDGTIKKSKKTIPDFNCIKEFNNIIKNRKFADETDTLIPYNDLECDTLINPFTNKTYVLYSTGDVLIKNKYFKGNIKIVSDKSVKVSEMAQLQDVILFAPYINFSKEFSGCIQAYATDSLSVEEKVNISYPSVLGLFVIKVDTTSQYIHISEKAKINGMVFLYAEKSPAILKPYIKIDKNAVITGQVICSNDIQLQGTVYGTVYCNRFVLKTYSSYYENNLLDVTIDYSKLPKEYIGFSISDNQKRKKIMKWFY